MPRPVPGSDSPLGGDLPRIEGVSLTEVIGRGGMGVVYRGKQGYLDRDVAVKLLDGRAQTSNFQARFQREAKILAGISHPNITACYQAGVTDAGSCYMVMELIEGPNLREWLEADGRISTASAVELVTDLAEALGHAMKAGIIHRDVKPDNVLLSPRPDAGDDAFPYEAKLADLGLARFADRESTDADMNLTLPGGGAMGTPSTMAPEQYDSPESVDHRADIYGLGCVLFHVLTGQRAFPERTKSTLITRKMTAPAPDPRELDPSLPKVLGGLVQSMLAKDAQDRPHSYPDLLEQLQQCLRQSSSRRPSESRDSGAGVGAPAWRRPLVLGAALAAVLGLGFLIWPMIGGGSTPRVVSKVPEQVQEDDGMLIGSIELQNLEGAQVSWSYRGAYHDSGEDISRTAREQLMADLQVQDESLELSLPNLAEGWRLELVAVAMPAGGAEPVQVDVLVQVAADDDAPHQVQGSTPWAEVKAELQARGPLEGEQPLVVDLGRWADPEGKPVSYRLRIGTPDGVAVEEWGQTTPEFSLDVSELQGTSPVTLVLRPYILLEGLEVEELAQAEFVLKGRPNLTWVEAPSTASEGEEVALEIGCGDEAVPASSFEVLSLQASGDDLYPGDLQALLEGEGAGRTLRLPNLSRSYTVRVGVSSADRDPLEHTIEVKAGDDAPTGGTLTPADGTVAYVAQPLALVAEGWQEPDEDQRADLRATFSTISEDAAVDMVPGSGVEATVTPHAGVAGQDLVIECRIDAGEGSTSSTYTLVLRGERSDYPITPGQALDLLGGDWSGKPPAPDAGTTRADIWGELGFPEEGRRPSLQRQYEGDGDGGPYSLRLQSKGSPVSLSADLPSGDWRLIGAVQVETAGTGSGVGGIYLAGAGTSPPALVQRIEQSEEGNLVETGPSMVESVADEPFGSILAAASDPVKVDDPVLYRYWAIFEFRREGGLVLLRTRVVHEDDLDIFESGVGMSELVEALSSSETPEEDTRAESWSCPSPTSVVVLTQGQTFFKVGRLFLVRD